MAERTETEVRAILDQVLTRAASDEAYFKSIEQNPAQVLREAGLGPDLSSVSFTVSRKSGDGEVEGFCNDTTWCYTVGAGAGISGSVTHCVDKGLY